MNIHDIYRPLLRYFRRRRMSEFYRLLDITSETRVLDVGGTTFNWRLCSFSPKITYINLIIRERAEGNWVFGDGCHLPFPDQSFDCLFSNSVIEHLGTYQNQAAFAAECRRVGKRYYIQTPNRGFPIELHLLTPFFHWLPRPLQRRMLRNFTVWGQITRPSHQACESFLAEICLLDKREFQTLFPDARIFQERVGGMVKSLIAFGGPMVSEKKGSSTEQKQ